MQNKNKWSKWKSFPDPRRKEFIQAPFGPGVYELRRKDTKKLVLYGSGNNCAYRMTSLLSRPYGQGSRRNQKKRDYVFYNLKQLEYHCCACFTIDEAKKNETNLKQQKQKYIFPT